MSHLTTQPSGYISPLAIISPAARGNLCSSYEAARDIVQKAKSGPFDWADRYSIDLLKSCDTSAKFKPKSVLSLSSMEKTNVKDRFPNIKSFDDIVQASLKGYVPHPHASQELYRLFRKASALAATSLAPGT